MTHLGDLCYNPANLKFGVICLNKYGDAIFSPIYVTFEIADEYDVDFIGANLSRWDFINHALRFQQGTVYERMAVSPEDFLTIKCHFPSKREQSHLSKFIGLLDERIAEHQQLVELLKKYKRGLSYTIFDAIAKLETSITSPFGSVLSILQNNTFSRDELSSGNDGVKNIHYGDVLIKYGAVLNMASTQVPTIKPSKDLGKYSSSSYLLDGDVVFADTAEDYSVGKATEIYNADGLAILSGLHTIPCRSNTEFAPMYLGYYFNSSYFQSQIYPIIQGTKVSSISKSEIIKTTLLIPPYSTQAKIATVLRKLDVRIKIEEKTVLKLIQTKHGLLQQLFI